MTFRVASQVAALRKEGLDIVDLAIGEPDLATPEHIREAAKRAIDEGATRYTESAGRRELRAAASEWLTQAHGVDVKLEQVLVSSGSKQALFSLFQVLLSEGDEVIVPSPLWISYRDMVSFAGGKTVLVSCEAKDGFLPDPEKIKGAITDRTRALLLNTPTNPTGAVYPPALLSELARLCARHNVLLVADTVYRTFQYQGSPPLIGQLAEEAGASYFIVDGVSKSYCMTGWRIGLSTGPLHLISAMNVLQSHTTSCPCSISQAAALAALTGPQDCITSIRDEFSRRRTYFLERLRRIRGVVLPADPQGAFYVFPSFESFQDAMDQRGNLLSDDQALVEYLLAECGVAVVAGSAFGAPGLLRLSYAVSIDRLELAAARIEGALDRLKLLK